MSRFTIKEPEAYVSCKDAAISLHDIANRIAQGKDMIRYSISVSYARPEDIELAISRKRNKSTK